MARGTDTWAVLSDADIRAIQGEALKRMRDDMDMPLETVANKTGLNEKTIRNAEGGSTSPKLVSVARLMEVYKPSVVQALALLGLDELMSDFSVYDTSTHHEKLLSVFKDAVYFCYYASGRGDIERMDIQRLHSEEGYLGAAASARGHLYRCRVTCAPVGTYAFFTFTSDPRLSDRAFMIMPYLRKLETQFNVGVGAILSLAYPSGFANDQFPCFQLAAVVSSEYVDKIGDETVRGLCAEYLRLSDSEDGFRVGIPDVSRRSDELFKKLSELFEKS